MVKIMIFYDKALCRQFCHIITFENYEKMKKLLENENVKLMECHDCSDIYFHIGANR